MFNSSWPLDYAEIFSVHILRRILLPSVLEKSLGFCRHPGWQDFGFTLLGWGGAYKWEHRTSIPWMFFGGVSCHAVLLFSCCCMIWCTVALQVFVQMHNAVNLKSKNTWLATVSASMGQWRHGRGDGQLIHVWEGEGEEGEIPAFSNSAVGLTVSYLA